MARRPRRNGNQNDDLPIDGVEAADIEWVAPTLADARAMPLSQALANARAEFGQIRRTKEGQIQNRKYMYADHADVLDAVITTLAKYEIEVAHEILYREMGRSTWMFLNVSLIKGEDSRSLEWPIGQIDEKNQTNGANLTYAKRYAISTILNLAPDDDTDGISPDEDRNDRRDSRDRGRDYDRSSNFDRDDRGEDPDAWRDSYGGGNGRGRDGRRDRDDDRNDRDERGDVRSQKVRHDPSEEGRPSRQEDDKSYLVALDSLRSAGNKRSCEAFWKAFKGNTELDEEDARFVEIKDLYRERWNHFKREEESRKDPLGAAKQDEPEKKGRTAPEPDVKVEDDHVSPDAAMDQITKLLENCGSIEEYDRILKENVHLFEVASNFPPDKELLDDMKDVTLERLKEAGDERTQRLEDVEDRDRRENGGPDIGGERF